MRNTEKRPGDLAIALVLMILPGLVLMGHMLVMLAVGQMAQTLYQPVEAAQAARLLLERCRNWSLGVVLTTVIGALLCLAACLLLLRYAWTHTFSGPGSVVWGALFFSGCMVFSSLLFSGLCLHITRAPALLLQAGSDLRQIESGALEEEVLWIYATTPNVRLDPPYQGNPMTLLHAVAGGEEPEERSLFLPAEAAIPEGAPYQWHMSPEWNEENAQKYQILYTTNFHIAAELNPLPGAGEGEP